MIGNKRVYAGRSWSRAPPVKRGRYVSNAKKRFQIKPFMRMPARRGTLTTQVKSIRRVLNRVAPEIKYLDVDGSTTNIPTTGYIFHCTQIAEGDTLGARDGQSIRLISINLCGRFVTATSALASIGSCYRLALVVDRQQVADTTPAIGDIFTSTSPRPETLMPNLNTLKRFSMLWVSPVYYPNMMVTTTSGLTAIIQFPPTQGFCFDHNWTGNLPVGYNGAATSDIQKNGVYFIVISSDSQATMDVDVTARLGFVDV